MLAPASDVNRSPRTGWTRAHWTNVADELGAAARAFAGPGNSLIDLPGPPSVSGRWCDGLEGFARTFLLAAFRIAGDPDATAKLADWYTTGLQTGTDPRSPHRWPRLDEKGQAKVECASIALALHLTRKQIWDRIDERIQARVVAWMSPMLGTTLPNNNWIWFQSITEAFLRSVGGPWSAADLDRNLELTESWYVGDGWYSDGDMNQGSNRNFDYYSGWAMQFYPFWYCHITGDGAAPLLDLYRARLHRYLDQVQHLVGADGAPVAHGRSLIYRFAMLAPLWVGAIFDATPLSAGRTRRLASGVLRHFLESGARDERGVLSIGWHDTFLPIRQSYSGPASPYWASKGFAGLLLPASHAVWTAVEQPLELECGDVQLAMPAPGWLVSGTHDDGIVRLINHGGDHARPDSPDVDDPFYDRWFYSSRSAPELGEPDVGSPIDSHVALVAEDGRASVRRPFDRLQINARTAVSRHRAHWPIEPPHTGAPQLTVRGPWLITASVVRGAVEVRLIRVDMSPTGTFGSADNPIGQGPWRLRVGGAALASDHPPKVADGAVRTADTLSAVVGLHGLAITGVTAREGTNPLGRYSATPWSISEHTVVDGELFAAAIVLAGVEDTLDQAAGIRIDVGRNDTGDTVTVRWPDGVQDIVDLPNP